MVGAKCIQYIKYDQPEKNEWYEQGREKGSFRERARERGWYPDNNNLLIVK